MDIDRLLVSRIIQDQSLTAVAEAAITPKFFRDAESRSVFKAILAHHTKHGAVPSLGAIRLDHPTYNFVKCSDPMSFLIDEIRERHKFALLEDALAEAADTFNEASSSEIMNILQSALNNVHADAPSTRDTDITLTGMERLARYLERKENPDSMLGIPTGFSTIDKATQGIQKEQLITLVGPPKAGKTTLMLLVAIAAWLQGYKPLFFTFEMSTDELTERLDAFRSGISASRLRNATFTKEEEARLAKHLRAIDAMHSFIMSADSANATTLSGIAAKIDQYKPDIVFVDGVYLLQDENGEKAGSPQALTNLTRGFKRMAQNRSIPVVISSQVLEWKMDRKKGITSNSIGYSSSFAQDSDTIIGVEKTDDDNIQKLKIVLARHSPSLETYVMWNWENGTFEELDSDPFIGAEGGGWDGEGSRF
jgi:replicative DNA helicase